MAEHASTRDHDSLSRRYAGFIENLPVGVYSANLTGRFTFCNRNMARMFGYETIKAFLRCPVISLFRNKQDRDLLVQTVMNRGRVVDLPLAFEKKDGSVLWGAVTSNAFFDEDGRVIRFDGVVRDISSEIDDQTGISQLDEMADSISDIVLVLDVQCVIRDINTAGISFLGQAKTELIGKTFYDFLVPGYKDLFALLMADIVRFGRQEGVLLAKGGDDRKHYVQFHAFLSKHKERAHSIKLIVRDATDRWKLQRERLAQEKFQGVLEMAGGAAHRLNQPLTILNNMIKEVLADLQSDDPLQHKIATMHDQLVRVNDIVRKISSVKKYEAMDYVAGIKIVDIDKSS